MSQETVIPQAFFWRRMHSIMGLWLSLFLIMHLTTNSQAALFLGEDGQGFIHAVNSIHALPYLPVIEFVTLGLPILIHGLWGIQYARTAKYNSFPTDGSSPALPEYPRNRAYTWQRITAWLLIFGILGHVVQMRFLEAPHAIQQGNEKLYMVRVSTDPGLYTLAYRLGVSLYDQEHIIVERQEVGPSSNQTSQGFIRSFVASLKSAFHTAPPSTVSKESHRLAQERAWVAALEKKPLGPHQVVAVTHDFGTAELFLVRDTFKSPTMIALYTFFVLAACFHGFNGLWSFLITWGVTLSERSQRIALRLSTGLMILISCLGLAAIWLTYWVNLRT